MSWRILDCTLRDGGYYTNWDFDAELVRRYARTLGRMPVDFLEVGYRNPPGGGYCGQYFHLSRSTLETLKEAAGPEKGLAVMVDAKSVRPEALAGLLKTCEGVVDLIRFALDPAKIDHGLTLAGRTKDLGFEVSLNLMYMHLHGEYPDLFPKIASAGGSIDWIYLVDSFGSVFPDRVREAIRSAKEALPQRIGFHGHDNLHLAFANALAAIEGGADILDGAVLGMGRGAGNLKTELILAYQSSVSDRPADLSRLGELVELFNKTRERHRWGTDLPYMISGLQQVPQKKVMKWVGMKRYSTASIISNVQGALEDRPGSPSFRAADRLREEIDPSGGKTVIIIGG
ncbi:MAG: beta/alpha barrel domain-containing protein, partial [Planctomycetota bacterium]